MGLQNGSNITVLESYMAFILPSAAELCNCTRPHSEELLNYAFPRLLTQFCVRSCKLLVSKATKTDPANHNPELLMKMPTKTDAFPYPPH